MSAYTAPLADMEFALREIAGMEDLNLQTILFLNWL